MWNIFVWPSPPVVPLLTRTSSRSRPRADTVWCEGCHLEVGGDDVMLSLPTSSRASSGSGHLKSEISRRAFQQWDSTHCMSLVVPWCGGIHTSASAEVWVLAAAPGDPLDTPAWNFLRHGDWSQFSNGHGMHGFTPVHSLTPKNLCWMNRC